jgi:hypothetical protein
VTLGGETKAWKLVSIIGYVLLSSIAIIVVIVLVFVAATAISWYRDDQMNAERLKTLQSDGLLSCHVDRIVPMHSRDHDRLGTNHGIGFGGTSPTTVFRAFSLNGADPTTVMAAFTKCAQTNGWTLTQQSAKDLYTAGLKTFSGGWQASLLVVVSTRPAPLSIYRTDYPVVEINLSNNPERR